MKRIIAAILACMMLFALVGCNGNSESVGKVNVEISVKDYGKIRLELDGDTAPITVANFVSLVEAGFYDGLTFHRVVKGFMIQGGDPNGDGTGGSDKTIKGEFSANGVDNDISHERGVISMARSSAYDSASSQFFICHGDSAFLDGNYAAFGEVVSGMDVVDGIAGTAVVSNGSEVSKPVTAPVIVKATLSATAEGGN